MVEQKLETKKPKFTDEEIESIRKIVDDKDLFNDSDKEMIKKLVSASAIKDVSLGNLFDRCYTHFIMMNDSLFDDEEDYRKKLREYSEWLVENVSAKEIHKFISYLNRADGGIGSFYYEEQVNSIVNKFRQEYLDFVSFFGKVVGLEE